MGSRPDWFEITRRNAHSVPTTVGERWPPEGLAVRARIEDDTDRLTTVSWELLGVERSLRFAEQFEPPCEALLARVDVTAGENYRPASRLHD